MPSLVDKTLDGEDSLEPPPHNIHHPLQSDSFPGMPMHVYPIANPHMSSQQPLRSKRRQVKNACTHCQKACKKCDDARPCLRCVKYGISEECVDSQRKERKKGIKRGPYKKRDGKDRAGSSVEHSDVSQPGVPVSNNVPHSPGGPPIPGPYMSIGYPLPGFYGHYPPLLPKQGEGQAIYSSPQYFLTSVPPHIQPPLHGAPEIDNGYQAQGFYPATVLASVPYHSQYANPRSEGSGMSNQYIAYPGPAYHKQSPPGEVLNGGHVRDDEQEGANGNED